MEHNIILNTDSYKASHWLQYPPGTEGVFSYIESRGGEYDKSVMFGLQIYLKEYLSKPITQDNIDEAKLFFAAHGEPFNEAGWQHILDNHSGYLPVKIKAVPEGTVVPVSNVLATIENTDPKCFWLTSYLETSMLRAIWYGTTVATVSWRIKQIIKKYLEETGASLDMLNFKLHDFGARGVSSQESAGIGGAAHIVNFQGTDTIEGVLTAMRYYNCEEVPAFSIPAAEHSTITCWGKENETEAYRNMLNQYKSNGVFAVVSDSYDIYNAADVIWGQELKQEVIDSGALVVIRPDSGHPATVVGKLLTILEARFGSEQNELGYRLLNNVRIIQGDGINEDSIIEILDKCKSLGFTTDNLVFGMGGALLQHMDRDTMQWAMKCSAMKINGTWKEVYKQPATDPTKNSKRGRLTLIKKLNTNWPHEPFELYKTIDQGFVTPSTEEKLVLVFEDGGLFNETTFEQVRQRAELV